MKKRNKGSEGPEHGDVSQERGQRCSWLQYRFLAVVLTLAAPLAVVEVLAKNLPQSTSEVRPAWLLNEDKNLATTLVELYPGRAKGHIFRAYQAGMCFESNFQPPVCRQFPYQGMQDVRVEWEAAILNTGNRNDEDAFHNYAFLLYQLGEVERAEQVVKVWRANYPHSIKPHPRDLVESSHF